VDPPSKNRIGLRPKVERDESIEVTRRTRVAGTDTVTFEVNEKGHKEFHRAYIVRPLNFRITCDVKNHIFADIDCGLQEQTESTDCGFSLWTNQKPRGGF
jgi:hypothetical protein